MDQKDDGGPGAQRWARRMTVDQHPFAAVNQF